LNASAQLGTPTPEDVSRYLQQRERRGEVKVWGVRPFEFSSLLREHQVFRACSDLFILEHKMLPGGGSCGNFATDGTSILYLGDGKQKKLEDLLRREGLQFDRVEALPVAELFAALLLAHHNISYAVVTSAAEVSRRGCCVINEAERPKYESRIRPPRVTGDAGAGWSVEFYTLSGWMHERQALTRHLIQISPQYELASTEEVISTRVFSRTLGIVY
jgi:hypothetical protein